MFCVHEYKNSFDLSTLQCGNILLVHISVVRGNMAIVLFQTMGPKGKNCAY